MENRYFGERRRELFTSLAELNYQGNLGEIRKSLRERLGQKPMYVELEDRIKRDIKLLDEIILYNSS